MKTQPAHKTSNCPEGEDLVALLRDELDVNLRSDIEAHCEACPACRDLAQSLKETVSALEAVTPEPVTRDLAPDILARIQDETAASVKRPLILWPAGPARLLLRLAAALILALGIFVVVRQAHHSTGHATQVRDDARKKGLLWLVKAQDPSGKWDPERWGGRKEYTIGLTGMALLSLARDTEDLPGKADCMRRASDFLLSQQSGNGQFGHDFDGTMYNHGIATVALLEASSQHRGAVKKALGFIRNQQLLSGGWGYQNRAGEVANTSVSVWPLQALLLSKQAGWQDESHALKRGLAWMVGIVDHRGQFSYSRAPTTEGPSDALTAMGATCVLQAANSGIAIDRAILSRIRSALGQPMQDAEQQTDFYRTYFQICALDASRAEKWAEGLVQLQDGLVDTHEASGPDEGSWTPRDQWADVGGRIYSTALASLSLNTRSGMPHDPAL